jgi:hypothetical protein
VLTTMQQTSLAAGVATIGSLFLSLEPAHALGVRNAFIAVLAIQAAIAVAVAIGATTLPGGAAAVPLRPERESRPELRLDAA